MLYVIINSKAISASFVGLTYSLFWFGISCLP